MTGDTGDKPVGARQTDHGASGSASYKDRGAAWRKDFAHRAGYRCDTTRMQGHIIQPGCRQTSNHYSGRSHRYQSRARWNAGNQGANFRLVRYAGGRGTTDHYGKMARYDGQRQCWMWHGGRNRRRRMNGRMTMRRILQNHVTKPCCWLSHVVLLSAIVIAERDHLLLRFVFILVNFPDEVQVIYPPVSNRPV